MAYENIRFPRAHMAVRDEYYYYFDERNDTLNIRVCDGETAFSYPLDSPLGNNQVKAVEYDGYFFWTLQRGASSIDSIIKKWIIENYTCKLISDIDLRHTTVDNFSCSTFSLEYYNTTLSGSVSSHDSQVTLTSNYEKIEPGTVLTLGPNEEGMYEDVTVTGTLNNDATLGLDFYTFNDYPLGTNVYFAKSLWLVNDYYHKQLGGALYEISVYHTGTESVSITMTDHWTGSASNFNGSWEYTIASNVYLSAGVYSTTFQAYDVDGATEMSLRFEGVDPISEVIDIFATVVGNDLWQVQTGSFSIETSGYYNVKGRQHQSSSYNWGIYDVDIQGAVPFRRNGRVEQVLPDDDFEYVDSSCFYNAVDFQYVLYVLGTTVRFFNINNNTNEKSMLIDNIRKNQSTVIPVHDIKVEGETLYRLQSEATFFGNDYAWSTYNYQMSTIRPFIDSVSIDVNPKILPSNGINIAEVKAIVRDQYNDPLILKPVYVQDSDSTGFITTTDVYTNLFGVATTYYRAGIIPNSVIIRATATQYD